MSTVVKKTGTVESRTKALMGNFKRSIKNPHPHIKYVMTEQDVHVWYFIMGVNTLGEGEFSGDNGEFLKGQFIGKITATTAYPYGPPDVVMLTPTGVFPINSKDFCIDIGSYHKDNYPSTLGMDGYVQMIWSGLVGWVSLGSGINLIGCKMNKNEHIALIQSESLKSQQYNKLHNSKILALFDTTYTREPGLSSISTSGSSANTLTAQMQNLNIKK
jgi:ubiquitin-protein ligase